MNHGLSYLAKVLSRSEEESLTKHSTGKRSPPHPNPLPRSGGEGTGLEMAQLQNAQARAMEV